MTFYFDNNLSPKLAKALNELNQPSNAVKHITDRFPPNTPDPEWIGALGEDTDAEHIVVSGDWRITRNRYNAEAWRESGMTAFFLTKGWINTRFWIQAQKIVKCWPGLLELALDAESGSGYKVTLRGLKFERMY